jgi:hypothetical protein
MLTGCEGSPTKSVPSNFTTISQNIGTAVVSDGDTVLSLVVEKWRGGATAAISLNLDATWGLHPSIRRATNEAIARGLPMDLELVSAIIEMPEYQHLLADYREQLLPNGIRFFGHGHTHALHDTMEFDAAYESFRTNYLLMEDWGLAPKAYAYPGSSGERMSTQLANQMAGFICARGYSFGWDDFFITPHDILEPPNWYFLPSVVMGNASYRYIDQHEKLVPILDESVKRRAWTILMYHSIGFPEGWSYYPLEDFRRDLDAIQGRDFWVANMDAVASYVQERANVSFQLQGIQEDSEGFEIDLIVDDGLPDAIFEEPLTVVLRTSYRLESIQGDPAALLSFEEHEATFEVIPTQAPIVVKVRK